MNKEHAVEVMNLSLDVCEKVDKIIDIVEEFEEDEKRHFNTKLGELMLVLNCDIILSIAHQYPELDPDKPAAAGEL